MQSKPSKLKIVAMGDYTPNNVVDNNFLANLDIGTDSEWIESRVGIRERRSVLDLDLIKKLRSQVTDRVQLRQAGLIESLASMVGKARNKIKNIDDLDQNIGLLLHAGSTPDYEAPANACSIAKEAGFDQVLALDFNSACSSFVVGLKLAEALHQQNPSQSIALSVSEKYTTRVDYADRNACILFGDAATYSVLSPDDQLSGFRILDTAEAANNFKWESVAMPSGEFFGQDGKVVQRFAVSKTIEIAQKILERNKLSTTDITYFVGHQANLRMLKLAATKLGFSEQQHLYAVDLFGNVGAAGAPLVLSQNWSKFKPGDKVVVSVVGAGLTWAAALLEYIGPR